MCVWWTWTDGAAALAACMAWQGQGGVGVGESPGTSLTTYLYTHQKGEEEEEEQRDGGTFPLTFLSPAPFPSLSLLSVLLLHTLPFAHTPFCTCMPPLPLSHVTSARTAWHEKAQLFLSLYLRHEKKNE